MKKLIFIAILTFLNLAKAQQSNQQIEFVSLKQAEDILSYRAATTAADVLGKWKKVLHGPSEYKMGQYNPQGIVEGKHQKVMTLTFSTSDLSNWLPQEVSTVNAVVPENIMTPEVSRSDIDKAPKLGPLRHASVEQTGNGISFTLKFAYQYQSGRDITRSHTLIPGLIFTVDSTTRHKEDESLSVSLKYICALQQENNNRLVCEQKVSSGAYRDHGKGIASHLDFPKVVAFERVK